MLDTLNNLILVITRPLLDWMLNLPRDVVLFIVAIGTALILTGVRVFTTDQGKLKRCKDDKARIKVLMREAKRNRDKDAVMRYRTTIGQIGIENMKAEGKPLLASLVPIALLAVWAFASIAYVPPQPDQEVTVVATFPIPQIDKLVHLVPVEGVEATGGWIQRVAKDYDRLPSKEEWELLNDPQKMTEYSEKNAREKAEAEEKKVEYKKPPDLPQVANGAATWTLKCRQKDGEYPLTFRFNGKTFTRKLVVDGKRYADPVIFFDDPLIYAIEVKMDEYKPFGVVPGFAMIMLQPWIVGYLLIVLPFSLILKPALRIY